MAKRPIQKSGDTRSAKDSPDRAEAQATAEAAVAAEVTEVASATNTEGGEAERSVGAPMAGPGAIVQDHPGGGDDGDAGAPAGDDTHTEGAGDAENSAEAPISAPGIIVQEQPGEGDLGNTGAPAGNPSTATALDELVSGGGGRTIGFDLAEIIAGALAGERMPPIPTGSDLNRTGPMLKVTGPKKGRRRAGRSFGREPVFIRAEDLTEEELAALQADPTLVIEIVPES